VNGQKPGREKGRGAAGIAVLAPGPAGE